MVNIKAWLSLALVVVLAGCAQSGNMPTERGTSSNDTNDSLNTLTAKNYPINVPGDATQLKVEIVNGSGDLDLYLNKGSQLSGGTIAELNAAADYISDGPAATEQITVTPSSSVPLSSGTWYAAVLNLNASTTSFTLRVSIDTPDTSTTSSGFTFQKGLWWNSKQPGHGAFLTYVDTGAGKVVFLAFYTYDESGLPTWYLAEGMLTAPTWSATLRKFTWNGSVATPTDVGPVTLEFKDRTHAEMRYTINGKSVSEDIERFALSRDVPDTSYTGLWYQLSKPGFGFGVDTQGVGDSRVEYFVIYFYDAAGQPRWTLTIIPGNVDPSNASTQYPTLMYRGSCPYCTYTPSTSEAAGGISRGYQAATFGSAATQILLPAPLNSAWNMTIPDFTLLSDEVDEDRLELEIAVDLALGIGTLGSDLLGDWLPLIESLLGGGGSSTCPTTTTSQSGTGTAASPLTINITGSFGSGCTGADGSWWSGSFGVNASGTLGVSAITAQVGVTLTDLYRDRIFLGTGTADANLNLTSSGGNLLGGTATISTSGTNQEGVVSGSVNLNLQNLDLSGLLSAGTGSGSLGLEMLLDLLGSSGNIQATFNNLREGANFVNGTASFSALSATRQRVQTNLTTHLGAVIAELTIDPSGNGYVVNSATPASVAGYTVDFEGLKFDESVCETNGVGGSLTVQKGVNKGRFGFDTTPSEACLAYSYQKLP